MAFSGRVTYSDFTKTTGQLYLDAQHQLAAYESTVDALRAEVEVISDALDGMHVYSLDVSGYSPRNFLGDEGSQNLHAFHSSTFSIPTQCAYCQVGTVC